MTVKAMRPAVTGAISAGRMILLSTTPKSMAIAPTPTRVAPMRPPKRACDELDGRPSSQVSMFHVMAPINPAKISGSSAVAAS